MSLCNYCGNRGAIFEHCKSELEAVAKCEYKENEMTDTKPTIDEQIASQKHLLKNHSGNGYDIDAAVLASLEELKRIQSAKMPEPVRVDWTHEGMDIKDDGDYVTVESYDELLAYAQRKDVEAREAEKREQSKHQQYVALKERHEKQTEKMAALIAENEVLRILLGGIQETYAITLSPECIAAIDNAMDEGRGE